MTERNISKKKGVQGVICSPPCTFEEEEVTTPAKCLSCAMHENKI